MARCNPPVPVAVYHCPANMKIKTISRDATHHTRECVSHKQKVFRNADPKLHPMEKAREVRCFDMCTASLRCLFLSPHPAGVVCADSTNVH